MSNTYLEIDGKLQVKNVTSENLELCLDILNDVHERISSDDLRKMKVAIANEIVKTGQYAEPLKDN